MTEGCVVYHGSRGAPAELAAAPGIEWRPANEFTNAPLESAEPAVLIADGAMLAGMDLSRSVPSHVVVVAMDEAAEGALGERADMSVASVRNAALRERILSAACRLASSRLRGVLAKRLLSRSEDEYDELRKIGMALMDERNLDTLLGLIVRQGKRLTESDGGGLLFLEPDQAGVPKLRPVVSAIDSLPEMGLPDIEFPIDENSILGHAALTKEPVVVVDAQKMPPGSTYITSVEFRQRFAYSARSVLAVPMLTQQGQVLGVLIFFNRKADPRIWVSTAEDAKRYVLPFEGRHVRLARSLASMAAVSIENARLYQQIEHILESFVKASVSAVDARDPATAGHSLRVAALTATLADAVQHTTHGPYRDTHFTPKELRELHFAALLHDIGKVAVREDVLVKAKKLPPVLWERIDARFALIRRTIELEHCRRKSDGAALAAELRELDQLHEVVRAANEPTVLAQPAHVSLADIAARRYQTADGETVPWLTPDELRFLQLARGTLDERERAEVESHVEKTHQFLRQIPWTEDLKNVVRYASGHHEKLNGSGYPKRLTDKEIPIQTRMITLADVFDALTSSDRPYKPAVSVDKALEIISAEAKDGQLDPALVELLSESISAHR